MSIEAHLRHEYLNGNLAFLFDFDGTMVPKGKPKPSLYTQSVINRIKPNLVVNTARWGPTCVRHFLGEDTRVIGAQGMEFRLEPDQPAQIWGDPKPVCSRMLSALDEILREHPLINVNRLHHEDGPVNLFIQWRTDSRAEQAAEKIINMLTRHEQRGDYHHRHIWTYESGCVEITPKVIDKRAAIIHALDVMGLFAGKTIFSAGDTPETDGPFLDELKRRGHPIAFVGDQHHDAHLRYKTPEELMGLTGRIVGLSPPGQAPMPLWQLPKQMGRYSMLPVVS
jgi:hypothetical protein